MIDEHCGAESQHEYLEIVGPEALAAISDWREQA